MTDYEKEVKRIMDEYGMTRKQAERYIDSMGMDTDAVHDFEPVEERWSATCPWKAPGMRISDFL